MKPTIPAKGTKLDTPALMKVMFDLAAVALKCDLTRVITFDLYDDGGGDPAPVITLAKRPFC